MEHVILVIHLLLALSIIGLVLIQRSEGGGLGIGGGGGGMGNFATAGQTASALVKATRWAAAAFFCTSITLAILAGTHSQPKSLLESLDNQPVAVDSAPETSDKDLPSAEAVGESPKTPSAPISE